MPLEIKQTVRKAWELSEPLQKKIFYVEVFYTGQRLEVNYDSTELLNGDTLYTYKHLLPGKRVRLEY